MGFLCDWHLCWDLCYRPAVSWVANLAEFSQFSSSKARWVEPTMILDQQNTMSNQIIEFPDWVFSDLPRFDQIKETIIIRGTNSDTSSAMGGSADERED